MIKKALGEFTRKEVLIPVDSFVTALKITLKLGCKTLGARDDDRIACTEAVEWFSGSAVGPDDIMHQLHDSKYYFEFDLSDIFRNLHQ